MENKQVFHWHVGRWPHGPSGIRLHPGLPDGGRERAGHASAASSPTTGSGDDRIFTDVASGRNMRRPAWQQLREKLQHGDVVVVPRLDQNALWGGLPSGLGDVEGLTLMNFHSNLLTGPAPSSFARLPNLERLWLSHNSSAVPFLRSSAARPWTRRPPPPGAGVSKAA